MRGSKDDLAVEGMEKTIRGHEHGAIGEGDLRGKNEEVEEGVE